MYDSECYRLASQTHARCTRIRTQPQTHTRTHNHTTLFSQSCSIRQQQKEEEQQKMDLALVDREARVSAREDSATAKEAANLEAGQQLAEAERQLEVCPFFVLLWWDSSWADAKPGFVGVVREESDLSSAEPDHENPS